MRILRTFAFVSAGLLSGVCVAGAPAGPDAAEDILRQNPQIKTLPGVPSNLKGGSIQDCPAGGTPDISRNRCVIVVSPPDPSAKPYESNYGVAQAYILILHPNSPKVWGVFQTDPADPSKTNLLGEFDVNGKLTLKGTPAPGAVASNTQAASSSVAMGEGFEMNKNGSCKTSAEWRRTHPVGSDLWSNNVRGLPGPGGWAGMPAESCQQLVQRMAK